jgi:hypothetical protein
MADIALRFGADLDAVIEQNRDIRVSQTGIMRKRPAGLG